MSVENTAGDGFANQPSIIYAFDGGDEIREIARSGYGEPGPSPGDIIERETTRSSPTSSLPELELPGQRGLKEDDCGKDIPVFACEDCGHPQYVGRTCASPVCERDWPAAVKRKVVRSAGKLEGLRRKLYAENNGIDIDFNHVIASLPDFQVDSDQPVERAWLVLKTLLEKKWGIEGFLAIYHPYRIKQQHRQDQYEHGGAEGDGDMTWKDVMCANNPMEYLTFKPHFHLFFPARRASFDYLVAEGVQEKSGWLFHRVTKHSDTNISVFDLEDLVHQLTYCFSHAGVNDWNADRFELTSRMKGALYNIYIPEGVEDKCLSIFCDAAPKLLGTRFSNVAESSCGAEVSDEISESEESVVDSSGTTEDLIGQVRDYQQTSGKGTGGGTGSSRVTVTNDESGGGVDGGPINHQQVSPVVDNRTACNGGLVPMHQAIDLLEDPKWCREAAYVSRLRKAAQEWKNRTNSDVDLPWTQDEAVGDSPVILGRVSAN